MTTESDSGGSVHVVGIGTSALTRRGEAPDEDLVVQAVGAALRDAGVPAERLGGLNVQSHHAPGPDVGAIVRRLGASRLTWAPAGGIGVPGLVRAVHAVESGRADVVAVCKVMNTATALNQPVVDPDTRLVHGRDQFELPYGLGYTVQRAALLQRRWMWSRGVRPEQLGVLCTVQRGHAMLNDDAVFRTPLGLDDYLASRTICEPIRLYDCDMPVNGAHAYVVTADPGLVAAGRAVRVAGHTAGCADEMPHVRHEWPPGVRPDVAALLAGLGITAAELSALMLYDGFSFLAAEWLERLGVVAPDDVADFIGTAANLRFDGPAPLNTHGGQLSEGRMHGAGHVLEAVRQLRGEAGPRQVAKPRWAAVTTAFPSTGAVAVLEAAR